MASSTRIAIEPSQKTSNFRPSIEGIGKLHFMEVDAMMVGPTNWPPEYKHNINTKYHYKRQSYHFKGKLPF